MSPTARTYMTMTRKSDPALNLCLIRNVLISPPALLALLYANNHGN